MIRKTPIFISELEPSFSIFPPNQTIEINIMIPYRDNKEDHRPEQRSRQNDNEVLVHRDKTQTENQNRSNYPET